MGAVGGIDVDPDGEHIWAVIRCDATEPERFGNECLDSDLDPVLKFDPDGNVVESLGSGMFIWPHGIDVDPDGNVWVTDAVSAARTPEGTRGHQVIKFNPEGEVLMRLGTPGVPGSGPNHFNAPSGVVVADNGDIFVADGHGADTNNRVVKFSSDGAFIKAWGRTGYAPGEFRTLHAIAIDARGRVFVGDRSNNRIQIFDHDGNFLAMWTQFGRPSGIFFDANDHIYVADSESDDVQNPGWEMGIRIEMPSPGGCPSSFCIHGATRALPPAMVRSSLRSIGPAICTVVSPARGNCRSTSGFGGSPAGRSRASRHLGTGLRGQAAVLFGNWSWDAHSRG